MAFGVTQAEIDDALREGDDRVARGYQPDEQSIVDVDEAHLVDYVTECVKESFEATERRRELDEELWRAHESELREYADKEDWQSKIVLNSPWGTTYQATSIVRRGMIQRPDYFDVKPTDPDDPAQVLSTDFWKQGLTYWTAQPRAKLQYDIADASSMGFACGLSQFIKFLWKPDDGGHWGLETKRFEPWKQYADPDRLPRKPWSGLYAIHEEFVDLHVLQEMQANGLLQNIDLVGIDNAPTDTASMYRRKGEEQREEERRKSTDSSMRNKYRKQILVREFWGTVLDASGRLAAKNVSFTVAGSQVIRPARNTPFTGGLVRWPWVDWSPIPHVTRYHGYGLFEGVLAIWKLKSQLLNLYLDNENFRINNMFELDPSKLRNPADDEVFPGKKFIRKIGAEPGPAVMPVAKSQSNLQDVQFIWGIATQLWENGSFVTEFVKGEQGSRRDITATEVQAKTQQAMGVFDSIGSDIEDGAVSALHCAHEVLRTFWYDLSQPQFKKMIRTNPLAQAIQQGMMPQERMQQMALQAEFKIGGVSKAFEKSALLTQLKDLAAMGAQPQYAPYIKPFELFKEYAEELNKPHLAMNEQELAKQQEAMQQQQVNQAVSQATDGAMQEAGLIEGQESDGQQPKPGVA